MGVCACTEAEQKKIQVLRDCKTEESMQSSTRKRHQGITLDFEGESGTGELSIVVKSERGTVETSPALKSEVKSPTVKDDTAMILENTAEMSL